MAEENYSPYSLDVLDYIKELSTTEAEKFGAAKEPVQQYQQSLINQESSLKNINKSYSSALSDLYKNTAITEQDLINNILGQQANPLALNQAKLNVQQQQGNSLKSIREKVGTDVSLYNKQTQEANTAFTNSLGYNKDFLATMFNRMMEVQKDKAYLANKTFDNDAFASMFNNYLENKFKPI